MIVQFRLPLRKPTGLKSVAASRGFDAAGRLDDFAAAGRLSAAAVTGMAASLQLREQAAAVVAVVAASGLAASRGRGAAGLRSDFAAASGLDDFAAASRFAAAVLRMAMSLQAGQQTAVMTAASRFAASRGRLAAGFRSDFAAADGLDVAAAVTGMTSMQAGEQADVMMAAAVRRSAAGRGDDRFATAGRSEREDLGGQQEASRNAETEDSQVHFQSSSNETEDLLPAGRGSQPTQVASAPQPLQATAFHEFISILKRDPSFSFPPNGMNCPA